MIFIFKSTATFDFWQDKIINFQTHCRDEIFPTYYSVLYPLPALLKKEEIPSALFCDPSSHQSSKSHYILLFKKNQMDEEIEAVSVRLGSGMWH